MTENLVSLREMRQVCKLAVTDTYSIGFWPGLAWLLSVVQTLQSHFQQKLGTRILFPPLQYRV